MMMKRSLIAAFAAPLLLTACQHGSTPEATEPTPAPVVTAAEAAPTSTDPRTDRAALVARIKEVFGDPRFANAHWGVMIKSLKTGEVWYEQNANKMFNPASNQKIPTTAAALLGLGPTFRYVTTVAHTGTITDGVLKGDLVVFGQGDPTFYTRWLPDSRDHFRAWARDLKARGITRIDGNVLGDDNAWDDVHTGNGWPLRDMTPWYYAEYGALQFNENYIDLKIIPPATLDGTVTIQPNVPSSYFTIVPNIKVVESGGNNIDLERDLLTNTIHVTGQVRAGSPAFEETPTITNPTLFFVTVLHEVLREEGIEVTGQPIDADDREGWKVGIGDCTMLIAHESPPMDEILAGLFKRSQNMYAESMPYTLAWKRTGKGTFSGGRKAVQEILQQELGVSPDGYQFSDGSGLSRQNYITPATIIAINEGMRKHALWPVWYKVQSIAGVDGTLRNRMKDTKAANNVRGKTGTISNVRALSGYVTTAAGEELAFSFIVNGHMQNSAATDSVTDTAAVLLAEYEGN